MNNPQDTIKVLELVEKYLVERHIETRGITGRTIVLPAVREHLAKLRGEGNVN